MRKKSKKFEKKHSNIGAMQEEIRRGKVIFLGKFSDWKGGEGFGGSGMGEAKTDPVLGNGHDWPKLIK